MDPKYYVVRNSAIYIVLMLLKKLNYLAPIYGYT